MINAVRSRTFIGSRISSSVLRSDTKWVSASPSKDPSLVSSHPIDHLRLFFDGREKKKQNTCELALVSALKSCSSQVAISQGQQIHSLCLKTGLVSNIFVQNSLINVYAKCGYLETARLMFESCSILDSASWNIMVAGYVNMGRFEDAHYLFETMPCRDFVSFTTMIIGLAKCNRCVEALEAFKEMRAVGVSPNEVTLASVFSAYARLDGIHNGCMLHALVIKLGLESFNLVSTNLVYMYSVCSNLDDAKIIFDEILDRNIVTWNVMLNGYSKAGLVDLARDLFEKIPIKDLVSWGTMLDGYIRVDRLMEALAIYSEMLFAEVRPNEVMIVDLVSACGRIAAFSEGQQLHGTVIKSGFDSYLFMQTSIIYFYAACQKLNEALLQFELGCRDNVTSWNALIAGFIRNGMVYSARQVFNEMPERDVISWSSMISGYARSEKSDMALKLFHEMLACGIKPNEITMVSVLSAIATSGTLEQGRRIHDYMYSKRIPLNDNLSAGLIDMYAKCGSINSALQVFNQIRDKIDSVSPWNAIICGLAMHGHAGISLRLFSDLQRIHIKPNEITFVGVLSACCHAGLVKAGEQYFQCMKNVYNINPNIKHYGCMVDLLGRAGRLEEAEQLVAKMPMDADVVIWGTLLAACRTHGNVKIGERAAKRLAKVEPAHGAGQVLLSNIYADTGRWDDVYRVRRTMQMQRTKKLPGCSGIM